MVPAEEHVVLLPNRTRHWGEAMLALLCLTCPVYFLLKGSPGDQVGGTVSMVLMFLICAVGLARRALLNYDTFIIYLNTRQIVRQKSLLKNGSVLSSSEIGGLSSATRSITTDNHDSAVVLYLKEGGHIELRSSTHPALKSLVRYLDLGNLKVPLLGEEFFLRGMGKPRYRYDPK